jgi:XapX domain-containing protein
MKPMLIWFIVGLAVGAIYALLQVQSPASRLIALAGLRGFVRGSRLCSRCSPKRRWSRQKRFHGLTPGAPGQRKTLPVETNRHAFAYVFAGSGKFCNASGPLAVPTEGIAWLDTAPPPAADNRSLVVFDRGDEVEVHAGPDGTRFLLVSGKPLGEPIAWYGPTVMNTQEQLRQAFVELEQGTFLKR